MVKEYGSDEISKSEACRRWGISPSMISKYVAKGMPVLPSGKLSWAAVDAWRADWIIPERSGSYWARYSRSEAGGSL